MRKFLYTVVFLILLTAAVLFGLRMYSQELTQLALVPTSDFVEQEELADNAYANPAMWFSRPGMGAPNDPARWQPGFEDEIGAATPGRATPSPSPSITPENVLEEGNDGEPVPARNTPTPQASPATLSQDSENPRFAVFFVHPTSFFNSRQWNAPLEDADSQALGRTFVRGLGSAFNRASEIWAPRYRQATFGAFVSDSDQAERAIDAAYRDVETAFDYFVKSVDPDMPIVLAGHSQGSLHVLRLLREKVAGTELQSRIAMAYPIGWPISVAHDLPSLPLPACATPQQGGCVVSWASFAEPADPAMMLTVYRDSAGFDGQPRADSPILCVNPISGMINGSAPASANLGTLVPNEEMTSGDLVRGAVPARCGDGGLLMIGDPPEMGTGVLPLNNYHVYDIPLFWANLQQDVVRRVSAWETTR